MLGFDHEIKFGVSFNRAEIAVDKLFFGFVFVGSQPNIISVLTNSKLIFL